ncbi:MAG: hypothetical protein A2X02_03240 [Bacteroidetes bacterium GWF2_29_10]|nr:MAG: hypothetical protein A2X02_03240 [Bacteroidetes bacterium GWF2_29_10]
MQTTKIVKRYTKTIIIIIYLLFGYQTNAQKKITDNLSGMINFHSGYNLPEYPFNVAITEDYIRSLEICLLKETVGKNQWEQIYNYPSYGVSLFYSTLGNDEIFGREFALTYFIKSYLLSKNRLKLFNRTGVGISYVNRKFDLQKNYLNVAIGANFNIHFNFRIGANYALTDKLSFNTGLSFDHFSNANTSEPNLGINYLTGYGGVSYNLGEKSKKQIHKIEEHVKENNYSFFAGIGGKHSRALLSKYFLASSFSFEFNRAFTKKFNFGIGSDLFYDSSVEESMKKNSQDYKKSDSFKTGIHLSPSIVYNKFSFSIQEGIYFLLPEQLENYLTYNRAIAQFQVDDHLIIRFVIKSHLFILDYHEIGFGYKF